MTAGNFYVYIHTRLDTNEVFYVGKGTGPRAWWKWNRNSRWHNIVNKTNYTVTLLYENLTEEDSFIKEKETILHYKMFNQAVANFTTGGEGSSGRILKQETKEKISQAKKNPSKSTRDKISAAVKENWANGIYKNVAIKNKNRSEESRNKTSLRFKGKKLSNETRQKMSESRKGSKNPKASKVVYVFKNNRTLETFVGTRVEFCEYYKVSSRSLARLFILKRPYKTVLNGWYLEKILNVDNI